MDETEHLCREKNLLKLRIHGMDFDYNNAFFEGSFEDLAKKVNDADFIKVKLGTTIFYINSSYIIDFSMSD